MNKLEIIELPVMEESKSTYDLLEKKLKKFFREKIYIPILKELNLPQKLIKNAANPNPLADALFTGKITYTGGRFSGEFNAEISKALKALGAVFDRKTSTYKLPESQLPAELKANVSASQVKFQEKMAKLDKKLAGIIPDELAKEFKCADLFDQTLFKADKSFQKNVKKITVTPTLSESARKRISTEWQDNMQLWIKDWTGEQIQKLRSDIYEHVVSGGRREALVPPILKITKTIQGSHDEAVNKAKFLAHQETRLLMAKFKEVRYTDAGIHEYIWRCVHRPHDASPKVHIPGNVRYSHGQLDGKIFRFDSPPISTNPGEPARRNNPGQDYNCRCFSRPILRKKTA